METHKAMPSQPTVFSRMYSCLRERRPPDTLLALIERQQEIFGPAYYRARQERLLKRAKKTDAYSKVRQISTTAYAVGKGISMGDIVYGPAPWEKSGYMNRPWDYYYFLAGFIKSQKASQIVEIGTWYGGSSLAMRTGFDESVRERKIVTVDPEQRNLKAFEGKPEIIPIEGDAADDRIVSKVASHVHPRIDILYIDGDHRYEPTKAVVEKYGNLLKPRWMILDDIHWRWSMEKVWAYAHKFYFGLTYDAGNDLGFMVPKGFGVIDCRDVQEYVL